MKSAVYHQASQSAIDRCDTAALKRSVWPMTQFVSRPPPLPPVTPSRLESMNPLGDHRVHGGHQVLVVVAGVVKLDDVAEVLAVGRAAARVHVRDDVAASRLREELVRERVAVGGMRAAVNLENQRVLLRRIESGRRDVPAVHRLAVERFHDERLWRRQVERSEQRVVHRGDALRPAVESEEASTTNRSPMLVGVAMSATRPRASALALKAWTSWSPFVIVVSVPSETRTRMMLARPRAAEIVTSAALSGVHAGREGAPPRGAR